MASPTTIIVKVIYDDETRRFSMRMEGLTYTSLHNRVAELFGLEGRRFKLQYKDDEGDLITMSSDEEMEEAVAFAISVTPSVLRISVKKPSKVKAAPVGASDAVSAVESAPAPPTNSEVEALVRTVREQLPSLLLHLPESVRSLIPHAELDIPATIAANAEANAQCTLDGADGFPSGLGYGDVSCHPGVTCDKSGQSPIQGNRYNLKGHNYDLCEAEFLKLSAEERAAYIKIPPPFSSVTGCHPGVTCDKSGQCPIIGNRFKLKGSNYDLCEAEFLKLAAEERQEFVKIPPVQMPPTFNPGDWRRAGSRGMGGMCDGWRRTGGACRMGSMVGGKGRGCGEGKLASRFVSDVSIFDGTQMEPGTKFTKIWKMKNAGEVAWPPGCILQFVGGDQMGAPQMTLISADDQRPILPGEEIDVAVDMCAPSDIGRYLGYWRIGTTFGRKFGQRVWCTIQVVDSSQTVGEELPAEAQIASMMATMSHEEPGKEPASAGPTRSSAVAAAGPSSATEPRPAPASTHPIDSWIEEAAAAASAACSMRNAGDSLIEDADEESDDAILVSKPSELAASGAISSKISVAASSGASCGGPDQAEGQVDFMMSDAATELLQMGFDEEMVEAVLDHHQGKEDAQDVAALTKDLLLLHEWGKTFEDLAEMGFEDRGLTLRLMLKNDGSLKRTVKDLINA